ncbi:MAG: hypothetical protein M1510_04730 [Nitrospirae bacterium]|nr:hypothetical protein [Nitrospirota bacterium]
MSKYIVGTKFLGHDTNVAVIDENGRIVMAIEEERIDRIKHSSSFPLLSLREALDRYNISPKDVAYIATPFSHELFFDRIDLIESYFKSHKTFDAARYQSLKSYEYDYIQQHLYGVLFLEEMFPNATVIDVRHHLTHAANAFYCSPFENAAILSIDANGEIETTMLGRGRETHIEEMESIQFPHSLGFLYEYVSEWLGLGRLEGPGKTMGLASYGTPRYLDVFRQKLIFLDEASGTFQINPALVSDSPPPFFTIDYLTHIFGRDARMTDTSNFEQFHADVAATLQAITEEAVLGLVRRVKKLTGERNLCISGGVALNCMANGRIHKAGVFENIFIQPSANDGGSGLGAALYAYYNFFKPEAKRNTTFTPYTGSSYTPAEIEEALQDQGLPLRQIKGIEDWTAEKLSQGWLIGWFQGAMELGPRALGNRSILADPTRLGSKELLNSRVKYREWWRPFAPIVLYEHAQEYFDVTIEAPYMLIIGNIMRDCIPAVSHIDKTARVQTVRRSQNQRLYDVISSFKAITGVPVLLNTSFNVRGEPLVRTPHEALNCLFREGLDAVVLDNYVVLKSDLNPARHQATAIVLKGRPEYEQFLEKKRLEIEGEVSGVGSVISGNDSHARLLFVEALKRGKEVEGFTNGGRSYLDTLKRQTLFGRKIIK